MSDEPVPSEPAAEARAGLDIGQVLMDGLNAFRSRLKDFLVVAIGIGLAYGIVTGVLLIILIGIASQPEQGTSSGGFLGVALGVLVISLIFFIFVAIFVAAIQTRLALAAVDGDNSILGNLGREAMARIGPFFGWGLASSALVLVGLALCVLPGIAAAFFLAFTPFVVIEGRRGGNPLKHSFEAVKERAGELIIVYLVLVGIGFIVSLATYLVQGIPFIGPIIQGIVSFAISGFALCTYAVIYRSTSLGALAASEPQVLAPPVEDGK